MTGQNGAAGQHLSEARTPALEHMEQRLLTAEDVAALLQVRPSWVYMEARSGRLPCVPVGRYRRFRQSAVDRWLGELEAGRR